MKEQRVEFYPQFMPDISPSLKMPSRYKAMRVGWFSNKQNSAFGWVLTKLDAHDLAWLKELGMSPKGILRSWSDRGNTNLVKVTKTGMYGFADNEYEMEHDKLRFERLVKMRKIIYNDESIF